ncbi:MULTISPECIES: transposase [unclassified Bradyrhizobium]|uniref:transposase n=1 Tax=unclassified Bradyrhizobium TaxID=2631580 RepID=UPI002915CF94|nr:MULTISPECIES: transposase [unclassified Bradyrhizobium]
MQGCPHDDGSAFSSQSATHRSRPHIARPGDPGGRPALAAEYYALTGKPLGVTGEIVEFAAAECLGLELSVARAAGYDAIRHGSGGPVRILIKGRACTESANRGERIGRIKPDSACDVVLLVLLDAATDCMLRAWEALWAEYKKLHDLLVQMVGRDELCRRCCATPGVGPVTALTFKAAIDDPHRFSKSKTEGAHFRRTSRRIQTGTSIDIEGHISKCGDGEVRTVPYESASAMLERSKRWCGIKAWGVRIAAKRGHKCAVVAVARKLAVVMHRMWIDGSVFRFRSRRCKCR